MIKTSNEKIIGVYCPNKIEDTSKRNDGKHPGYKKIVGGKPFLFYFYNDSILSIIKFKDDEVPEMSSESPNMLHIEEGITINLPAEHCSQAYANSDFFIHPKNIGDLEIGDEKYLYFAGGESA